MVFVPPARGYFSLSKMSYTAWDENVVWKGMQRDALDLIRWARALEVSDLLIYDENGESTL